MKLKRTYVAAVALSAIVKPPSYVPPCSTVSGTGGLMLSA